MDASQVIFDTLLPLSVLSVLAALALACLGFGIWRGLTGWWLRGLALAALGLALANPSIQLEDRTPLSDIVLLIVDDSSSQRIADRPAQTTEAIAAIEAEIGDLPNTELRIVTVADSDQDQGTLLMRALTDAMADEPRARLAGAIFLSDGRLHDIEGAPDFPAPVHLLLTGKESDWDRRLSVQNAPAFAILGEPVTLTLRIEDDGSVPEGLAGEAPLEISVDGGDPQIFNVPVGQDLELPVTLPHGGRNVIQFRVPEADGELTDRNNAAIVQINGVRDRLRVLLVSGEPHPGERTWRNLLKSDASVDLVHFTILRPPEKQDGVPVSELSLIAFPTRELFLEKIDQFDLIIFDRYKRRGILPSIYLDNVRQYVENGGALLVAAGPDFAGAESIYRSPLADALPAAPSGGVIEQAFVPQISDLGQRHPVTEGLAGPDPLAEPNWGSWLRLIDLVEPSEDAQIVMTALDERPLLVLERKGEGRVALLGSDHAWLWSRGYEGGGPQLELLRRLAHWLMREPELEEEALTATAEGQRMTLTERTLGASAGVATVTAPDGTETSIALQEIAPGRFQGAFEGPEIGLYRIRAGDKETVIALGPAAPREFVETIASGDAIAPVVEATNGGVKRIEDGIPDIRRVRAERPATGRGWIAITPRDAFVTADIRIIPLLPAWAFLLLSALLAISAWLWEGRRTKG